MHKEQRPLAVLSRPDYLLTVQGVSSEDELERFEAQIQEKLRGRVGRVTS